MMRMAIKVTVILIVVLGLIVEIIGVFYARDPLSHNAYGWGGGVPIVLGAVAIQRGMRKTATK